MKLRRLTLTEQVAGTFVVGIVYLVVVGVVAYASVTRFADMSAGVESTHVMLRTLEELFSIVTGAETGSRGFVITGDARYLEPFRSAEVDATARLKALESMTAADSQQHRRLVRLMPLVARRFAILDESVRLRTSAGFEDAASAGRTEAGRVVMDSIRAYVEAMSSAETARLRDRSAQEQGSLTRATSLIGVSVLAAVILGIAAALKVTRDLGMRLRAEEEARHAKEVAEAASRAKSEFLAMMSHELRTPLNSVIGFSNVLLRNRGGNLSDKDQLYLQRIQAGGKHLLSLIDEVLDLSKIEAGRMRLDPAPVALGELVTDTVASFEGQLKERPISLQAVVPDHLSPIITDPAKLLQVLTNLIGNAIKFTEHGSVTVVVMADPASRKPERIEVRDTGIGIPLDRQQAIFDAFEQADTSTAREYGGSGLGLALSKSLCDLMGYQLAVESEVGRGSTFSIALAPLSGLGRRLDRERLTPESNRVHATS